MQDNGELIDIDELLTMKQYQTLYKSFESEYDNFRHIPFLEPKKLIYIVKILYDDNYLFL
jgi:hypothetical protein